MEHQTYFTDLEQTIMIVVWNEVSLSKFCVSVWNIKNSVCSNKNKNKIITQLKFATNKHF